MRAICASSASGSRRSVLVIVGVTLPVPAGHADKTLFVTIPSLQEAYERTIRREIKKFASIRARSIDKLTADQVAPYLACKLHVNAFDPRREFSEYAEMYASALAFETKSGATLMTQAEIVHHIARGTW